MDNPDFNKILAKALERKSKHVEMIIDYLCTGDDFLYNDNKGLLIRCKDCENYAHHDKRCKHWNHGVNTFGFCDFAISRKEDKE